VKSLPDKAQREFMKIARTVKVRRPYDDDKPLSYLECDDDYFDNNRSAAIKLLDLATKLIWNMRERSSR
jgi:hypothetical protein